MQLLDLTSGWNVVNAGWDNAEIDRGWQASLGGVSFRPSWTTDDSLIALNTRMREMLPGYSLIPSCTGSEAMDNALKVARMVTGRAGVLSFFNAYHGSSTGAALATGYDVPHLDDLGLASFKRTVSIPRNEADFEGLERHLETFEAIGAIVVETIATNAGCIVLPGETLERISALASSVGALLICDEIGTGLNRTGTIFSFSSLPLVPSVIAMGKALTNGLYPLSLCLVRDDLMKLVDVDAFASTYGGAPSGCKAALSTLDFHQNHDLGARSLVAGATLRSQFERGLSNNPLFKGVHGRGLELAVHIRWEEARRLVPRSLLAKLRERGIFATMSPNDPHLMIIPPLTTELRLLQDAADSVITALRD